MLQISDVSEINTLSEKQALAYLSATAAHQNIRIHIACYDNLPQLNDPEGYPAQLAAIF